MQTRTVAGENGRRLGFCDLRGLIWGRDLVFGNEEEEKVLESLESSGWSREIATRIADGSWEVCRGHAGTNLSVVRAPRCNSSWP